MGSGYSQLVLFIAFIALLSPVVASALAVMLYAWHCQAIPNPEERISLLVYVAVLVACAAVAFFFGLQYGVIWACSSPSAGNLCGLAGFFIVGPLAAALAILVSSALMAYSRRG